MEPTFAEKYGSSGKQSLGYNKEEAKKNLERINEFFKKFGDAQVKPDVIVEEENEILP